MRHLKILEGVRNGFYDAYTAYLEKTQGFVNPPKIGDQWPRDGYFLPSMDVFKAKFESRTSSLSIQTLMDAAALDISSSE